ncbi:CD180 antigen (predicted), isoform CRA_c [Rattus norvegicus]|uniref:CD180 antigen (Predicted), isoform CRA_c n=1 Tax=Rattus norvegicus TaxID=10116 RepID=A6I5D5_RAT|nr:CD180 antigen (predicted), isoform CRA_c [Rattus norvegicus]
MALDISCFLLVALFSASCQAIGSSDQRCTEGCLG